MKNFILQIEDMPRMRKARITLTVIDPGIEPTVIMIAREKAHIAAAQLLADAFGEELTELEQIPATIEEINRKYPYAPLPEYSFEAHVNEERVAEPKKSEGTLFVPADGEEYKGDLMWKPAEHDGHPSSRDFDDYQGA